MKYTIIHINDRAATNINYNKNILKNYEYVDNIWFFDSTNGGGDDILNHWKIPLNVWSPYDGRIFPPLPGEYGVWISLINCLKYIKENKINNMLIFEDDILLSKDFVNNLNLCLEELPDNFDFLSLYYFKDQNNFDEKTDINKKYIHKSLNQFSAGQAWLISESGAKKILKSVQRKGIEYTSDCFIFKQSHIGVLNGYSIKPDTLSFLVHDYKKIKSTIDPLNTRNTDG